MVELTIGSWELKGKITTLLTFVEAWVVTTTVQCSPTLTSRDTLSPSTSPPPNVITYSHWLLGIEDAQPGTSSFNCQKKYLIRDWHDKFIWQKNAIWKKYKLLLNSQAEYSISFTESDG